MPECTNCGTELSVDFTDEVECDGGIVILYQEGYCPNCGKHHTWQERYTFVENQYLKATDQGNPVFFGGLFAAALSCEQPEFSIIPHVSNFVK